MINPIPRTDSLHFTYKHLLVTGILDDKLVPVQQKDILKHYEDRYVKLSIFDVFHVHELLAKILFQFLILIYLVLPLLSIS